VSHAAVKSFDRRVVSCKNAPTVCTETNENQFPQLMMHAKRVSVQCLLDAKYYSHECYKLSINCTKVNKLREKPIQTGFCGIYFNQN